MAEETPQPGVQTAAMLWRKSSVQLDETARDGIQGFTDFLDFYASLASRMRGDAAGMTRSPFLPGAGYGEYAVDAKRKASEVRQHLGLGQGPVADIAGVCEALGITIYRAHLGSDLNKTISGAFYKHPALGFSILVNLDMTRGRRRFTAAHELAHALLHSGSEAIVVSDTGHRGDQREAYADAFAGEFLMPEEGIRRTLESLGAGPKVEDVEPVIHLQRMFNVSYITALVRLRQANIITAAGPGQTPGHPPGADRGSHGIPPRMAPAAQYRGSPLPAEIPEPPQRGLHARSSRQVGHPARAETRRRADRRTDRSSPGHQLRRHGPGMGRARRAGSSPGLTQGPAAAPETPRRHS